MFGSLHAVTYFILAIISLTGTVGNLAVLVIFCKTRAFQTHNNALHVSLAVADLISCALSAPVAMLVTSFSLVDIPDHHRIVLCHVQHFLAIVTGIQNALTTTAICVLRTKVLLNPTWIYSAKTTYHLIALTWVCSLTMGTLSLTVFQMESFDICCVHCEKRLSGPHFATNFGLPTIYACTAVMLSCYAVIYCWNEKNTRAKCRENHRGQVSCNSDSARIQRQISIQIVESRNHLYPSMTSIHTTFILAVLIIVSYAPITILSYTKLDDVNSKHSWYSFSFAFLLLANSLNPYIYTLRCAAFRKEICRLWTKIIQHKYRFITMKCKV